MLIAVFEIAFFLLLASLLGGAAGWWLARSGKISVAAAMRRSGAHAAADRELESARAEIARLSSRLAVATEAIRELEADHGESPIRAVGRVASLPEPPAAPAKLAAVADSGPVEAAGTDQSDGADTAGRSAGHVEADVTVTVPDAAAPDPGSDEMIMRSARSRGGKRLSDRVAEASTLTRHDRSTPKIKFDDSEG